MGIPSVPSTPEIVSPSPSSSDSSSKSSLAAAAGRKNNRKEGMVEIRIKSPLIGKDVILGLNPERTTLGKLRRMITGKLDLIEESQLLLLNGVELPKHPNFRLLSEFGITEGSVLTLMPAMKSGLMTKAKSINSMYNGGFTGELVIPPLTEEQIRSLYVEKKPIHLFAKLGSTGAEVELTLFPEDSDQPKDKETAAERGKLNPKKAPRRMVDEIDYDSQEYRDEYRLRSKMLALRQDLHKQKIARIKSPERRSITSVSAVASTSPKKSSSVAAASSSKAAATDGFQGFRRGFLNPPKKATTTTSASASSTAPATASTQQHPAITEKSTTTKKAPMLRRGFLLPPSKKTISVATPSVSNATSTTTSTPTTSSLSAPSTLPSSTTTVLKSTESTTTAATSIFLSETAPATTTNDVEVKASTPAKKKPSNSCFVCQKKLTPSASLMGTCRCGQLFCAQHRSSIVGATSNSPTQQGHICAFNYKKLGSEQLKSQFKL